MQTFSKQERLCSEYLLKDLFAKGKSLTAFPIKLIWMPCELAEGITAQAAVTVPRRLFKRAVDRNLLKRRMREAYRKDKSRLYSILNENDKHCVMMFIYVGKEIFDYSKIEKKISTLIEKLSGEIREVSEKGKVNSEM